MTPQDKVNLHNLWVDFEMRLASLSSRGKWVLVPDSGHMIPFERPEINCERGAGSMGGHKVTIGQIRLGAVTLV